jgi:hypothetical protein
LVKICLGITKGGEMMKCVGYDKEYDKCKNEAEKDRWYCKNCNEKKKQYRIACSKITVRGGYGAI